MSHSLTSFPMTRRRCIVATILSVGAIDQPWSLAPLNGAELRSAEKQKLLVRSQNPYNAEPDLEQLNRSYMTPVDAFYVRSHGSQPALSLKDYRLTIDGLVDQPKSLTVEELTSRFTRVSTTATLTCAGNRRTEFYAEKKVPGVAWEAGAIGNAEWSGVLLSDVLKSCGIQPSAKHVWFEGLDEITVNDAKVSFGGSISLDLCNGEKNSPSQPLLVDRMNGKSLLPEHGFPLRTLVPGLIGARSVKWLGKITVSDKPSSNHYLARAYKVVTENTPEKVAAADPIYEYVTNSAICRVAMAAEKGVYELRGYALAGGRPGNRIKTISVKCEQWKEWKDVEISSPVRDFCWVLWSAKLSLPPEARSIQVRAIDELGFTQPVRTPWNAHGYQYNGWHSVQLPQA